MSGIPESKTLPMPYAMSGYGDQQQNQQNQQNHLQQHDFMSAASGHHPHHLHHHHHHQQQQQQQQQQQLDMNLRLNSGRNVTADYAADLAQDSWNSTAGYVTGSSTADTILSSTAAPIRGMASLLSLDNNMYSPSPASNMTMPSMTSYQTTATNHYETSTPANYQPLTSSNHYQTSTTNYQPSSTQSYHSVSNYQQPTNTSYQSQNDGFQPSPTYPTSSSILMTQSFTSPAATQSFTSLAGTQSFTSSTATPPFSAPSHPQSAVYGSVQTNGLEQLQLPQASIVVPMPAPQTNFSRMPMQHDSTLDSNIPKMPWSNDNSSVLPSQANPVPVWVPIHPATGTSSAFVRISEVLDDEPSPVQVAAALAHSPLSIAASSIQGSPGQYKPLSGAFAQSSSPLWNQQRLPSVSDNFYAKPVSSCGLSDHPISQSIEDRPSTGGSSGKPEATPPASAAGAKPWATPADWICNRDIITQLYIDEDKPLKEVMELMANKYQFHATEKMYKIKIKKWNLKKNLRETEVQAIIQAVGQRELEGKPSAVQIHGKNFELTQIFRHAKKKGILRSQRRSKKKRPLEPVAKQDVPHYVRIYTPSPPRELPQYILRPPDSLHVPEQILCNLGLWMNGKVQSGDWSAWFKKSTPFIQTRESENDPSGASVTLVSDFYNHFLQGLQVLRTSRDVPTATRSFNIAFGTLKNVMMLDDPRVMAMLLLVGLRTEKEGHGRSLGEMLWRYVSELSPACLGVHSPLNRVWGTIATAFIHNDVGQSMVLMRFLADQIKQWTDNVSVMYMDFFMFQSEIERLCYGSSPATRATLRQMLYDTRMMPEKDYNNIILQKNLCHQLARSLIKDNFPEEARQILLETPHAPLNNSRSSRIAYLDLLANIEFKCGMPDIAAETMEKGVYLATQFYGEFSSSTMYMSDTLIKIYYQMGALQKAEDLQIAHSRRERYLENFHSSQLPVHIPPVQIGCTYE